MTITFKMQGNYNHIMLQQNVLTFSYLIYLNLFLLKFLNNFSCKKQLDMKSNFPY